MREAALANALERLLAEDPHCDCPITTYPEIPQCSTCEARAALALPPDDPYEPDDRVIPGPLPDFDPAETIARVSAEMKAQFPKSELAPLDVAALKEKL